MVEKPSVVLAETLKSEQFAHFSTMETDAKMKHKTPSKLKRDAKRAAAGLSKKHEEKEATKKELEKSPNVTRHKLLLIEGKYREAKNAALKRVAETSSSDEETESEEEEEPRRKKCSHCRTPGHTIRTCPDLKVCKNRLSCRYRRSSAENFPTVSHRGTRD